MMEKLRRSTLLTSECCGNAVYITFRTDVLISRELKMLWWICLFWLRSSGENWSSVNLMSQLCVQIHTLSKLLMTLKTNNFHPEGILSRFYEFACLMCPTGRFIRPVAASPCFIFRKWVGQIELNASIWKITTVQYDLCNWRNHWVKKKDDIYASVLLENQLAVPLDIIGGCQWTSSCSQRVINQPCGAHVCLSVFPWSWFSNSKKILDCRQLASAGGVSTAQM